LSDIHSLEEKKVGDPYRGGIYSIAEAHFVPPAPALPELTSIKSELDDIVDDSLNDRLSQIPFSQNPPPMLGRSAIIDAVDETLALMDRIDKGEFVPTEAFGKTKEISTLLKEAKLQNEKKQREKLARLNKFRLLEGGDVDELVEPAVTEEKPLSARRRQGRQQPPPTLASLPQRFPLRVRSQKTLKDPSSSFSSVENEPDSPDSPDSPDLESSGSGSTLPRKGTSRQGQSQPLQRGSKRKAEDIALAPVKRQRTQKQKMQEPSSAEESTSFEGGGEDDGQRYRIVKPKHGTLVEARWDQNQRWYSARILKVDHKAGKLLIRWEGNPPSLRQSIDISGDDLRPHRGTQSFEDSMGHPDFNRTLFPFI